jgi:hypothetical protein
MVNKRRRGGPDGNFFPGAAKNRTILYILLFLQDIIRTSSPLRGPIQPLSCRFSPGGLPLTGRIGLKNSALLPL